MFEPIYFEAEKKAIKLLNSKKINHKWKKDFKLNEEHHEKWDLINSQRVKIEVKSTLIPKRFNWNSITPNFIEQKKQIILKLLLNKKGKILDYKFVKFRNGKWYNITNKIIYSKPFTSIKQLKQQIKGDKLKCQK